MLYPRTVPFIIYELHPERLTLTLPSAESACNNASPRQYQQERNPMWQARDVGAQYLGSAAHGRFNVIYIRE